MSNDYKIRPLGCLTPARGPVCNYDLGPADLAIREGKHPARPLPGRRNRNGKGCVLALDFANHFPHVSLIGDVQDSDLTAAEAIDGYLLFAGQFKPQMVLIRSIAMPVGNPN